jgi:hypothetical protein
VVLVITEEVRITTARVEGMIVDYFKATRVIPNSRRGNVKGR